MCISTGNVEFETIILDRLRPVYPFHYQITISLLFKFKSNTLICLDVCCRHFLPFFVQMNISLEGFKNMTVYFFFRFKKIENLYKNIIHRRQNLSSFFAPIFMRWSVHPDKNTCGCFSFSKANTPFLCPVLTLALSHPREGN